MAIFKCSEWSFLNIYITDILFLSPHATCCPSSVKCARLVNQKRSDQGGWRNAGPMSVTRHCPAAWQTQDRAYAGSMLDERRRW